MRLRGIMKQRKQAKAITRADEARLVQEWRNGTDYDALERIFNVTKRTIQRYVSEHRERLGLEPRQGGKIKGKCYVNNKSNPSEFDALWHGNVPCGHWMITNPWGRPCIQK